MTQWKSSLEHYIQRRSKVLSGSSRYESLSERLGINLNCNLHVRTWVAMTVVDTVPNWMILSSALVKWQRRSIDSTGNMYMAVLHYTFKHVQRSQEWGKAPIEDKYKKRKGTKKRERKGHRGQPEWPYLETPPKIVNTRSTTIFKRRKKWKVKKKIRGQVKPRTTHRMELVGVDCESIVSVDFQWWLRLSSMSCRISRVAKWCGWCLWWGWSGSLLACWWRFSIVIYGW